MSGLKPGDTFPSGIKFKYVPFEESKPEIQACGMPIDYDPSKEWKGKKVVLFAVPGAFTPGCSQRHLPGYIDKYDQLKKKGVDIVAVIAFNDPFVMSAWGKANNQKGDILFMTDVDTQLSKKIGWTAGERTGRYAIALDDMKVIYAAKEESPSDVSVSGVDAVLAKL